MNFQKLAQTRGTTRPDKIQPILMALVVSGGLNASKLDLVWLSVGFSTRESNTPNSSDLEFIELPIFDEGKEDLEIFIQIEGRYRDLLLVAHQIVVLTRFDCHPWSSKRSSCHFYWVSSGFLPPLPNVVKTSDGLSLKLLTPLVNGYIMLSSILMIDLKLGWFPRVVAKLMALIIVRPPLLWSLLFES